MSREADDGILRYDGEGAGLVAGGTPWEWGGLTENNDNTFALAAAAAQHGNYGYRALSAGVSGNATCEGYRGFNAVDEAYFRWYMYISPGAIAASLNRIVYLSACNNDRWRFGVVSGAVAPGEFNQWIYNDEALAYSATNFSMGAWHRIEIRALRGADSDGGTQVWIDGDLVFDQLERTWDYAMSALYLGGHTRFAYGVGDYVDYDDIKVSTSPIGAYTLPPVPDFTVHDAIRITF